MKRKMKNVRFYKSAFLAIFVLLMGANMMSCSDDTDDADNELLNKEYDGTLYGEWVEDSDNRYIFDYYCFYSDGTGIHGSYEPDIDWVNEDDDIKWYTVNDEYLYIDGAMYEYSCDGSTLEIEMNGRTRHYYEK